MLCTMLYVLQMFHHRRWLSFASFDSEGIRCKERQRNNSEDCVNYKECLEQAKNIVSNAQNVSYEFL